MPLWTKVWALRIAVFAGIAVLCLLANSVSPALAFALVWIPNGVFLAFFIGGFMRLPRVLVHVHSIEPVIYRWIGVGLVKRIVTTRLWLMLVGLEPQPKPNSRDELLDRAEQVTKGAEVCHGATLILALAVAFICLFAGLASAAAWILVFNTALNGYPVMLQRSNRWRLHQIRAATNLAAAA